MTVRNPKILVSKLCTAWFIVTLVDLMDIGCATAAASCHGVTYRHAIHPTRSVPCSSAIVIRGGSSDDDEDLEDDASGSEIQATSVADTVLDVSKRVLILLGKATVATANAITRAVRAGFQGDDAEEETEERSTMSKIIRAVKRMWTAALNPTKSGDGSNESSRSPTKKQTETASSSSASEIDEMGDFGSYLAKTYGVTSDRGEADTQTPVLGGTLGDALREARSQARLVVAFVPSSKPSRGKKSIPDQVAIQSLLSKEVSEAAEKRAKKKENSGSFILWGAKAGSPEAVTALKRLRAKQLGSKGEKRPILLVAYPAQVVDSSGLPKLVPRLLAQHHCSPPPSAESMAAWLNALRKRHSKQYSAMHHELREMELFKERQEGYKSSVVSDIQRKEQEQKEEEERLAREKAEKERLEELERRREELRSSLPEEPGKEASNTITIALRFADGRSGQRRFAPETPIAVVFNWVDGLYEWERETVILSTMNGQRTFTWEGAGDTTLRDAGLGKMTGLRVAQKKIDSEAVDDRAQQAVQ